MEHEEIAVKLAEQDKEIGSLKHRMTDVEEQNKIINNLVISVKELAINMQNMLHEQQNISSRLAELENKPAKYWQAVVAALIGAAAGAFFKMYF